jgi:uncharacterized membrane protein
MVFAIGHAVGIAFGAVYVLFLPGLAWSYAFFPRGRIDLIERTALSFALSIAIVPLVTFYLNLAGIKIALLPVLLEVAGVIVVGLAIFGYQTWRRRGKRAPRPH